MQWRLFPNVSAQKLAALSIFGVLVTEVGYIGIVPFRGERPTLQVLLLDLVPFVLGLTVYLYSLNRLKNSVKKNVWPEAELEPLRRITNSGSFLAIAMFFFAIFAVTLCLPRHYRSDGWGAWLLGMCLIQIANAVKKPPPSTPLDRIDWRTRPPLHSDHWGE